RGFLWPAEERAGALTVWRPRGRQPRTGNRKHSVTGKPIATESERMPDLLYGRNAVREALSAGRRSFERPLVSSGAEEAGTLGEVVRLAEKVGVPIERVDRHELDRRLREANHQGVALECGEYAYVELDDCLAVAEDRGEPALLLLLDHLQDPQNVGTL